MAFEIEGTIEHISEKMLVSEKYDKKEFVINTGGKYPQKLLFQAFGKRASICDDLEIGQTVNIHFNIKGNEYNERVYINLDAWKVEIIGGQSAGQFDKPPIMDHHSPPLDEEPPF